MLAKRVPNHENIRDWQLMGWTIFAIDSSREILANCAARWHEPRDNALEKLPLRDQLAIDEPSCPFLPIEVNENQLLCSYVDVYVCV